MLTSSGCSELELQLDGYDNKSNISVSRFTLKESDDSYKHASECTAHGTVWRQFLGKYRRNDMFVITDLIGIQLLSF